MTKFVRLAALAAAATLAATPALAVPVTGQKPTATARIIKPLTLTATGALNFATIVIPAGGVTADRVISLSDANVVDCAGGSAEVTCTGITSVPTYNVTGTNKEVVTVTYNDSTLTGSNGGTLTLTPTGLGTVTLPNSGNGGTDFAVGGDITISSTTVDGLYTGFVEVEVDY